MVIKMKNNLCELREDKEYTQAHIAPLFNITQQNYSRWETGEVFPPLFHLNTLANVLDSSIDYIMELTNTNAPTNKIEKIDPILVGKRIYEIRIDNKLSMRGLAKLLNTSHSTISNYEHGKNLIIISFAYQLSKEYNISLDWLCGRSENKYIKK